MKHKRKILDEPLAWRRQIAIRPAGMSRLEYLRFNLLFRQFENGGVPGMGTFVRAARWATKPFRHGRG